MSSSNDNTTRGATSTPTPRITTPSTNPRNNWNNVLQTTIPVFKGATLDLNGNVFQTKVKQGKKSQYQTTMDETHTFKLHIAKGNGPNHTLQQLIPHTIIPYKPPCEMIKKHIKISNCNEVWGQILQRVAKLNFFACVAWLFLKRKCFCYGPIFNISNEIP